MLENFLAFNYPYFDDWSERLELLEELLKLELKYEGFTHPEYERGKLIFRHFEEVRARGEALI